MRHHRRRRARARAARVSRCRKAHSTGTAPTTSCVPAGASSPAPTDLVRLPHNCLNALLLSINTLCPSLRQAAEIEFNCSWATTGWVAIGYSTDRSMPGTDISWGQVDADVCSPSSRLVPAIRSYIFDAGCTSRGSNGRPVCPPAQRSRAEPGARSLAFPMT